MHLELDNEKSQLGNVIVGSRLFYIYAKPFSGAASHFQVCVKFASNTKNANSLVAALELNFQGQGSRDALNSTESTHVPNISSLLSSPLLSSPLLYITLASWNFLLQPIVTFKERKTGSLAISAYDLRLPGIRYLVMTFKIPMFSKSVIRDSRSLALVFLGGFWVGGGGGTHKFRSSR